MPRPTRKEYMVIFYRNGESHMSTHFWPKSWAEAEEHGMKMCMKFAEASDDKWTYKVVENTIKYDDDEWARDLVERLAACDSHSTLSRLQDEAHEYLRECP